VFGEMLHGRVHDALPFCLHARMPVSFCRNWQFQNGAALLNVRV